MAELAAEINNIVTEQTLVTELPVVITACQPS